MPGRDGHLPGCHPSDARAPERHHHQCHVERHFGEVPPAAAYTATKQAIEGFSASLAHEPGYFGVGVKLVEPGYAPTTRFEANAIFPVSELLPGGSADFAQPILDTFAIPVLTTTESDVTEAIWQSVHDTENQLRFPAGADAVALARPR